MRWEEWTGGTFISPGLMRHWLQRCWSQTAWNTLLDGWRRQLGEVQIEAGLQGAQIGKELARAPVALIEVARHRLGDDALQLPGHSRFNLMGRHGRRRNDGPTH